MYLDLSHGPVDADAFAELKVPLPKLKVLVLKTFTILRWHRADGARVFERKDTVANHSYWTMMKGKRFLI